MNGQPLIVGDDRETGRTVMLARCQIQNYGTKRKPNYRPVRFIPRDILASPFWQNIRIVDELPKEQSND